MSDSKSMPKGKKKERIIMHLDMDAFFAAIEQLDHPEYRGKPVVVGADPKQGVGRGVVSTASYEARQYGIHSAMPISQAYRRCPEAIFLRGRYRRYSEASKQIMAILRDFTPTIQQISIDEAFLDLTGVVPDFDAAVVLGQRLKERIREQTGLTASIGLAANKFVAKVASDLEKPEGFTVCVPGKEREFLAPLRIRKLWGVGEKSAERLRTLGFESIGDIARAPREQLLKFFGGWGMHLWNLANGIDNRPVAERGVRKSISEEVTFDKDIDDAAEVERTLFVIADRLSRMMRQKGLKGRTITLKLRLEGFETHTRSKTLADFVNDAATLRDIAVAQFHAFPRKSKRVRLIGIAVSHLNTLGGEQLSLFGQESLQQQERFETLLYDMKARFGDKFVTRASFLDQKGREDDREALRKK